jgi:hypothetical protein
MLRIRPPRFKNRSFFDSENASERTSPVSWGITVVPSQIMSTVPMADSSQRIPSLKILGGKYLQGGRKQLAARAADKKTRILAPRSFEVTALPSRFPARPSGMDAPLSPPTRMTRDFASKELVPSFSRLCSYRSYLTTPHVYQVDKRQDGLEAPQRAATMDPVAWSTASSPAIRSVNRGPLPGSRLSTLGDRRCTGRRKRPRRFAGRGNMYKVVF